MSKRNAVVVRGVYNGAQPLQAVTISGRPREEQRRLVALGCGSHVEVVALIPGVGILQQCLLQLGNGSGGGGGGGGGGSSGSAASSTPAQASKFTVTDVRFSPHYNETEVVAASTTNGVVAVFDVGAARASTSNNSSSSSSSSSTGSSPAKWVSGENLQRVNRIAWHPTQTHVLASASMDGAVRLFDLRASTSSTSSSTPLEFRTRGGAVRDLQFDPFDEYKFATVCDSGFLSIWDRRSGGGSMAICKVSAHINGGLAIAYHPSSPQHIATTGSRDKMVKVWVGGLETTTESAQPNSQLSILHSIHTPSSVNRVHWRAAGRQELATCSSEGGCGGGISIWKLLGSGGTVDPVCVLNGHDETCTDFEWLPEFGEEGPPQHIVSVGKDGRMLVQDLRYGYFPSRHTARSVTTISSHGHVAFHRGLVTGGEMELDLSFRGGEIGSIGWFAAASDTASSVGEREGDAWASPPLPHTGENFDTGAVFCGLANIIDLDSAKGIRAERGAEGGVFDPAVISLLARSYIVEGCGREACRHNLQVASSAGLSSRAAIWTAALALLPPPPNINSSSSSSNNKMENTLSFAAELLGKMLLELIEGGDTQHFVLLCEVLRRAEAGLDAKSLAAGNISDMRRREAYLAYFDLLSRLQLFCAANKIIKASDEEYISKLSRHGVTIHTSCAKCGKETPEHVSHPWCSKCRRCAALCSLCHKPIKGLMHWCPVCGHGGHLNCTTRWFKHLKKNECPAGCGHSCCAASRVSLAAEAST